MVSATVNVCLNHVIKGTKITAYEFPCLAFSGRSLLGSRWRNCIRYLPPENTASSEEQAGGSHSTPPPTAADCKCQKGVAGTTAEQERRRYVHLYPWQPYCISLVLFFLPNSNHESRRSRIRFRKVPDLSGALVVMSTKESACAIGVIS